MDFGKTYRRYFTHFRVEEDYGKMEKYRKLARDINALEKDTGLFKAMKRVEEIDRYRED